MRLRALDLDRDIARYVELANLIMSEPFTEATLREWDANCPEGDIRHRVVAIDESGWVAGYAEAGRTPWRAAGEFSAEWVVDPIARNRGEGDAPV